jgi:hypothetical protein
MDGRRIAGRASPLRASNMPESEAIGLGSPIIRPFLRLTYDPAAEATHRTRGGYLLACSGRRTKNGPTEILFKTVRNICPQLGNLLRGPTIGVDFHHCAAINH